MASFAPGYRQRFLSGPGSSPEVCRLSGRVVSGIMFPCEGNSPPRGNSPPPPHPAAVAPERVTLNGNMFGEMLELDTEVAEEFGGAVLSVLELSTPQMSRLSQFYILIYLLGV